MAFRLPFITPAGDDSSETAPGWRNKVKYLVLVVTACVIIAASVLAALNFKTIKTVFNSRTEPTAQQALQTEINTLSAQSAKNSKAIEQLQLQVKALDNTAKAAPAGSLTVEQVAGKIDELSLNQAKVSAQIETLKNDTQTLKGFVQTNASQIALLQKDVLTIKENALANATNIGTASVSLSGLAVTFLAGDINLGTTGSATANAAQFAVKITNTTGSAISNLDMMGIISSSQSLTGNLASGYPQVTDAAGLGTMAIAYDGTDKINYELYGGSKGLSIPAGASITLRPKVSILAAANKQINATTVTIAISRITYDTAASK